LTLKIRNVHEIEHVTERSHGGTGLLEKVRAFTSDDFESQIAFIDYVVIPPGTTVGYHRHGNDEEVYFIIEGRGIMRDENSEVAVKKGDIILNSSHGSHGLSNNTSDNIVVLIFEVTCGRTES
jgi:mannose-6-phosphate isomerase-like protein (cupin superfamily)